MEANQKTTLPKVKWDQVEANGKNLTIENQWFFMDVPIFCSRVFCFVGTREKMKETAYAWIAGYGQEDAADCAKCVEEYVDRNGPENCETGDAFGQNGTMYIRLNTMYLGALQDVLVLNHECLHAANAILCNIGLEDGPDIEGLCYTHQFIFGELMKEMMAFCGVQPVQNPHKKNP